MDLTTGIYTIVITVVALLLIEKVVNFLGQFFGLYTIVQEKESKVFVLFGEVLGVIDEPGFHFLLPRLGPKALLVNWFGTTYSRSLKLNQEYLRSIPVNSEEGAPMGIGVWYEMYISDPVAHIFKNVDPQGSLSVNVKNDTIKNLSNLPLSEMLVNRHGMSKAVREEVSSESVEWGYQLGSVYIRKVHFRDENMIKQVEEKVVNRLRQVTSAIQQDGVNQVNIIKSKADREASIEFAKASAVRPQIVGKTLHDISTDQDVLAALFDILETQNITGSATTDLTLIPPGSGKTALSALLASK